MKKTTNNINTIDANEIDYLYINTSQLPNAGNGLRTVINIYKDEVISVFKGEILSASEANSRDKKNEDKYFINMLDGTIMDSVHTHCFAKYANDATGFSAKTIFKNNAKIGLDEDNSVCIIATRNIIAGEEIFCSYGKKYWKKHAKSFA
ncbi:MAG: SET domain-containing protein [Flavobacteriaceae bacterium]|nr:SET domain-containing protein [Flavobacteriaceae bacterium]